MAKGTLESIYARAEEPHFDLASEPWIPVVFSGGDEERMVSLSTLVDEAHRLSLSFADPMVEHAMLRFLLAGSHLSFTDPSSRGSWTQVPSGAPIPSAAVLEGLRRVAGSFWLFHPDRPFFQEPGLLSAMSESQTLKPARALFPYVPEGSNPDWFNRDIREPGLGMLASGLLLRHFFALPGNETPNLVLGGKRSEGGSAQLSHNGRSFVSYAGGTLASTLAGNLVDDWAVSSGSCVAFRESPTDPVAHIDDPLYLYSSSGAASLLVRDPAGAVLLAKTPALLSKQQAKLLSEAVKLNDPHALRTPPRSAAAGEFSHLVLSPDSHQFANMRKMFDYSAGRGVSELVGTSLLKRHTRLLPAATSNIRILNVSGAGSSTAAMVGSASASTADPASVRMIAAEGERAEAMAALLARVGGSSESARSHVTYRVVSALRSPGLRDAMRQKAETPLWNRMEDLVANVVERVSTSPEDSAFEAAMLTQEEQHRFVDAGLEVYDLLCGSAARLRDTSDIHRNRIALRRSLWRVACQV